MNKFEIKSIKGICDYLPKNILLYQYIENCFKNIVECYFFKEIRFPIIEYTSLFNKIINNYDSIKKQMYSFYDKNKINISLRPEGTIGCIKSYINNKLFLNKIYNKLWYIGPMFRYEKPQKGRFRQFYQMGLEIFSYDNLEIDVELILVIKRFFNKIGVLDNLILEINTIGSILDRKKYISFLLSFLKKNKYINNNKKYFNPLRLLDSKNKNIVKLLNSFPKMFGFINKESKKRFNNFCKILDKFNIKYNINYNLVRGLDYYNDLVFEWKCNKLGSQSTVCAGGRYNKLSKYLFNLYIPAIGCAFGLERLFIILNNKNNKKEYIDIFIISVLKKKNKLLCLFLMEKLLNFYPNLKINIDYVDKKKINKSILCSLKLNISVLIILGKKEIDNNFITLKDIKNNKQYIIYINLNNNYFFNDILNILNKILYK